MVSTPNHFRLPPLQQDMWQPPGNFPPVPPPLPSTFRALYLYILHVYGEMWESTVHAYTVLSSVPRGAFSRRHFMADCNIYYKSSEGTLYTIY